MKQILILGTGFSSGALINYLLENAQENDWFVTVGDLNFQAAQKAVGNNSRGTAIRFDVNDAALRATHFEKADIVVNFLPPTFQYMIALDCLNNNAHMLSASYENRTTRELDADVHRKGLLVLNEMGLDPGIDHMSAMQMIQDIRNSEGVLTSFVSYGSGIPAPEVDTNPLRYCITWNPRNVVRAGEDGAQYLENGKLKLLPHHHVFHRTWPVEVDGLGTFEAYPNRDSLVYLDVFGLENVSTMIRGTLRYPGWSETWQQLVRIGLPNDTLTIPDVANMTYREFTQMFLPPHVSGAELEQRIANLLSISPTGKIMENLKWLGLFSDKKIGGEFDTAADVVTDLLLKKLVFPDDARDMVILKHEFVVDYPDRDSSEKVESTFVHFGDPGGHTAMATSVGLPAAIGVKLILSGEIPLTGCHIPTHPAIYEPVLRELKKQGLKFTEKRTSLSS